MTDTPRVSYTLNADGTGRVWLNGTEIPVERLTTEVEVGQPTRVTLTFNADVTCEERVDVRLGKEARK